MKSYIDTSVFGGYFDVEFEISTKQFFAEIEKGYKTPFVSNLTVDELQNAPQKVKDLFNKVFDKLKIVQVNKEILELANAYIKEKALSVKSIDDAIHIATTTVFNIGLIVSWNFKHIVNLNRIRIFNAVNIKLGYPIIEIRTPKEVLNTNN